MNYFYTKFVSIESISEELHSLDLSDDERIHLASLIDSSIHHAILDEILSALKEEDKKLFLKLFAKEEEQTKIMEFLDSKVEGIQGKIKKVADDLVTEMHKDIKDAKRSKGK